MKAIFARWRQAAKPAWSNCQAKLYEAVLLDIWMPGIDGLETLARIQELPVGGRPAVIMISGHGNIETAVKATKLGAFRFRREAADHRQGQPGR